MAKKINPALAERLSAIGIKTDDEKKARAQMLKILADNDIDGMEEEDTDSLLDMCESMVDVEEPVTEEEENDALADEVEDDEEDDEEDEVEDETEETEDEVEDDEKNETEETEDEVEDAEEEKEKPKPQETKEKKSKKTSAKKTKLDPKKNKDDRKFFKVFEKFFPVSEYEYCWLSSNGVTLKYKGMNSSRAVISVEFCTLLPNGDITCNAYFPTFAKKLEILDNADIEYKLTWNNTPGIMKITFAELEEIVKQFLDDMISFVNKMDKRLGDNRKKMEESLEKTTKKEKKATKKEKTAEKEKSAKKKK